jgi:hypothetical protein
MTIPCWPAPLPGCPKQFVIVLEEGTPMNKAGRTLKLPTPHPVGPADPTCTYRRKDMYGDDGR